MSTIVLETDRLVVRLATSHDVPMLFSLWTDPKVMTNVGFPNGLRKIESDIQQQIEAQSDSELDQLLIVTLKSKEEPIGECRMTRPDGHGISKTDIKLLPQFWGNKYGVEVKKALVSYLFAHTDCVAVEGSPNVDNIASIKMQEAVGGVRINEATYEFPENMRDFTKPVHHYVYRVHRETWVGMRNDYFREIREQTSLDKRTLPEVSEEKK